MFKITKDGATVAMTEAPNYIKQAENGCFVLCPEAEATGIAHNGTVYHLLGRPDMAGVEITVMLEETDAGVEIAKAADATGIVFVTMAEAGSVDATTAAEHADLFAPWSGKTPAIKCAGISCGATRRRRNYATRIMRISGCGAMPFLRRTWQTWNTSPG